MSNPLSEEARVIPLRPAPGRPDVPDGDPVPREPLWRDLVGEVLRRERRAQERTLKDVADAARISLPYLSEVERGRKEASSEVLAAAAHALGLGLGDLLSLAHGELTRRTAERRRPAAVPHRPATAPDRTYQGLCLAA
ncbi:helix-turn-helix transcriptional regulator [Streptomyces sp. NPDC046870]|uniref:helix-turn-helix domain-containing protein n=1 Tax=Streptomyces sp. NPDC046870 TaxID=3155135 RepID=UPI0034512877